MDIGGSNGGSAALPTLKGCSREIPAIFLTEPIQEWNGRDNTNV